MQTNGNKAYKRSTTWQKNTVKKIPSNVDPQSDSDDAVRH